MPNSSNEILLEKLKQDTETHLNKLKEQQEHIKAYQSNVDILMKRYKLDESYFGKLASWYGSLKWWWRLLLGLTVISISAYIGVIISAPILTIAHYNVHLWINHVFIMASMQPRVI